MQVVAHVLDEKYRRAPYLGCAATLRNRRGKKALFGLDACAPRLENA